MLLSLGYFCLLPAILFALLIVLGTAMYGFEDGFVIPRRMRWPLAMVGSLIVFLVSSALMTRTYLRFLMYVAGAAVLFCAAIYDTQNAVELNAFTGKCGNAVMAGLMLRFACFSTFAGVPVVALAGLVGISSVQRTITDEPADTGESPN